MITWSHNHVIIWFCGHMLTTAYNYVIISHMNLCSHNRMIIEWYDNVVIWSHDREYVVGTCVLTHDNLALARTQRYPIGWNTSAFSLGIYNCKIQTKKSTSEYCQNPEASLSRKLLSSTNFSQIVQGTNPQTVQRKDSISCFETFELLMDVEETFIARISIIVQCACLFNYVLHVRKQHDALYGTKSKGFASSKYLLCRFGPTKWNADYLFPKKKILISQSSGTMFLINAWSWVSRSRIFRYCSVPESLGTCSWPILQ